MREPAHVFQLLETIYSEFDAIAKKRRIFKVETVGDCYVAACGIPDPRRDHAVAMVRFARDCRNRMMALMPELEVKLGPDTGELGLRVGIHSGPVTVRTIISRIDASMFASNSQSLFIETGWSSAW